MSRLTAFRHRIGGPGDGGVSRDARRDAEKKGRRWQKTKRWQRLRWSVLQRDLFRCRRCWHQEADSSQLVADHVEPHRGNEGLFWDPANLQCLCKSCHDGWKQAHEKGGYVLRPDWIRRPGVPVTLVCGPPASGKSTFVARQARPGDAIIDLDLIVADLRGELLRHDWDRDRWLAPAIRRRNELLADLADRRDGRAWVVMSAPRHREREWWKQKLGAEVVVLELAARECMRRALSDPGRDADATCLAITRWWQEYRA